MTQLYTATLVFKRNFERVALVKKLKGPAHLHGKWNGIGGKFEPAESPVGAAMRELQEETGLNVFKDDMVMIEHQRLFVLTPEEAHLYWFATHLPGEPVLPSYNDVGEQLTWVPVDWVASGDILLCPNVVYLIPKAICWLKTDRLARPC